MVFSAIPAQTTDEDLFYSQPNGQAEQNLTTTPTVSERNPRIDPFARTVVFEQDRRRPGSSRIYLYSSTPLTSGPATGPALPGTPYAVGTDADPVISPDGAVGRLHAPDQHRERRPRHVGPAHPEGGRRRRHPS